MVTDTVTGPGAPAGATAVICVSDTTVNEAAVPPKMTADAVARFVPVRVRTVPADVGPPAGTSADSVGGAT